MASSFAVEWAEHGIRVNSLSPGYMQTPLVKQVLSGQTDLSVSASHLFPNLLDPADEND